MGDNDAAPAHLERARVAPKIAFADSNDRIDPPRAAGEGHMSDLVIGIVLVLVINPDAMIAVDRSHLDKPFVVRRRGHPKEHGFVLTEPLQHYAGSHFHKLGMSALYSRNRMENASFCSARSACLATRV